MCIYKKNPHQFSGARADGELRDSSWRERGHRRLRLALQGNADAHESLSGESRRG